MSAPLPYTRRRTWIGGGLAMATHLVACKRKQAPKVEEVWDEAPAPDDANALAGLSPPWTTPIRALLDNGLLSFWLHEPHTPIAHARVLLPTDATHQSAAIVTILETYLLRTLTRRGQPYGLVAELHRAPDRSEIVLHGPDAAIDRTVELLTGVLSARVSSSALETARQALIRSLPAQATSDERASAAFVQTLLGRAPGSQRVDRGAAEAASRQALLAGWTTLVDPRRAVLIVHSGQPAQSHRATLRAIAERWRGVGREVVATGALERLHAPVVPTAPGRRLLAEPAAPLEVVPGPNQPPLVVLGRLIATPTASTRSLARLAQRVVQEELDARLVVRGAQSLLMLRVPLADNDPNRSVVEAIDTLVGLASTRQPIQRLFQAAQLWLGARVVQASLNGEDWTALWSEAMDLCTRDEDIAAALALDARGMLALDPTTLQQWSRRWLDPRGGEPGWHWVVAGGSKAQLRRLGRIAPLDQPVT